MGEAAGLQITKRFLSEMKRKADDWGGSARGSCLSLVLRAHLLSGTPLPEGLTLSWEKNVVVSEAAAGFFLRVGSWCNRCSSRQGAVMRSFQSHQCMSETGTRLLNGLL